MKKLLQILLLCLISLTLIAQDPHLSQFYMAPVYLNPALTGAFEGNYRLTGLYRTQWAAALQKESMPMYSTYTFSAEFRTNRGFSKGDAFGFGLSFLGDHAGEGGFGYNVGGVSIAYHKVLDQHFKNYLVAGFSTQLFQQTVNYANLQFGSQWDGSGFNSSLNQAQTGGQLHYWDMNAGLLWYMSGTGKQQRINAYLGIAAFHLNAPSVSLFGDKKVQLNRKFVAHGGISFPLAPRIDLQPKFIVMAQGQSVETVLGTDFRILLGNEAKQASSFHLGAMFRVVGGRGTTGEGKQSLNPEAIVVTAGVDWKGLNVSIAYDATISKLIRATNSNGGFEIGLNYVGKWNNKRGGERIYCPKF